MYLKYINLSPDVGYIEVTVLDFGELWLRPYLKQPEDDGHTKMISAAKNIDCKLRFNERIWLKYGLYQSVISVSFLCYSNRAYCSKANIYSWRLSLFHAQLSKPYAEFLTGASLYTKA